jgi:hypothetical protein
VEQEKIVQELGKQAAQVAGGGAQVEAAAARLRAASAEMLNRVVDAVRPALRAMSGRVEISRTQSTVGVTSDPAAFRGVELWGWAPTGKPIDKAKNDFHARAGAEVGWHRDGRFLGIILTDHGDLVIARYEYTESRDAIRWGATYDLVTAAGVIELVGGYFPLVLDAIAQALRHAALEATPTRAAEINGQAARVEAAALLLGVR